jgi:hypothetical protein
VLGEAAKALGDRAHVADALLALLRQALNARGRHQRLLRTLGLRAVRLVEVVDHVGNVLDRLADLPAAAGLFLT